MKKMICPECGHEINENEECCPNCGYPTTDIPREEKEDGNQLAQCPNCGKEISVIAKECPYCKEDTGFDENKFRYNSDYLESKKKNKIDKQTLKKIALPIYLIASLVIILGLFIGYQYKSGENATNIHKAEQYKTELKDYKGNEKALEAEIEDLESQVSNGAWYKSAYNNLYSDTQNYRDQQSTIVSLNGQVAELQSQNNSLQQQVNSLQSENDSLKASAVNSSSSGGAGGRLPDTTSDTSSGTEETVYWVAGGECYHSTPNCATLKRSSNIMSGSVSSAGGRRPCKVCH
mgnify:FL=1